MSYISGYGKILNKIQVPYPVGAGGSFSRGKETGVWSWLLATIWCRGWECVVLYLHCPIRLDGVVFG